MPLTTIRQARTGKALFWCCVQEAWGPLAAGVPGMHQQIMPAGAAPCAGRLADMTRDALNVQAPGWGILHHDEKHVLRAVDHEVHAGGAVPFDLPKRARRRRHRIAGIGTDAETVAKSETVARVIEKVARDAWPRPDVMRCHRSVCRWREIGFAVQ